MKNLIDAFKVWLYSISFIALILITGLSTVMAVMAIESTIKSILGA